MPILNISHIIFLSCRFRLMKSVCYAVPAGSVHPAATPPKQREMDRIPHLLLWWTILILFFFPSFSFFFFEFLQRVEIPHNASGMPRLLLHDANVLSTIKKATRSIHVDDKACSCILHSPLSTPPRKQCFWALERYFHPLSAQVNTARISFFRLRASRTQ